jgi:hypothetical protein
MATQRDITRSREELAIQLKKWCDLQVVLMDSAMPAILAQEPCSLEEETLFLPSDIPPSERDEFGLSKLANEEAQLWEGQAQECILQLRQVMKSISIMQDQRRKSD